MAAELQSALQVTAPSGALDSHMLIILAIMLLAGILGGIANHYLAERSPDDTGGREWLKYPVLGVVAALTVPLFLNMMSSTLLEGARTKPLDLYVFAGFCLIYVVASRRLFENVVQKLLGQIDHVRRDMQQIRQQRQEPQQIIIKEERAEPDPRPEPPRESLSYNDIEILRVLSEESCIYGNLASLCDKTGLARELVSQRLTVMKAMGIIETRINDKNVLHWFVSARGRQLLGEAMSGDDKKTA